jgi:endoribonuclease Dicer
VCYVLPAIIHRFESYLIALDACKTLDLDISPALALEALTKDSDNSEEHGEEKINFKSGMGPNYERLVLDSHMELPTDITQSRISRRLFPQDGYVPLGICTAARRERV